MGLRKGAGGEIAPGTLTSEQAPTPKRDWSQRTIQGWANVWAARLGLEKAPTIVTNGAEFARLTGYRWASRCLGVSGVDYTYVRPKGIRRSVLDTVIHELLHLAKPSWPHWKIRWTAYELARGRDGTAASQAKTQSDYLLRDEVWE